LLRRARERSIDVIAVTDHNAVSGGLVVQELAARAYPDVRVIVGEEVRTRDGEVLGLFLTEGVPRDLSAGDTIARIKAQGGLAGAPHPFDSFRSGLDGRMKGVAGELDFVEGLNARMIFRKHNTEARKFARDHGLPLSAASDAHSPREIGQAYVRMPDFSTPVEFLESLRAGRLVGRLSSPFIHWISRYATLRTRMGWRPPE
jgi:predicted metal-dependent phosphoesterase TrpH